MSNIIYGRNPVLEALNSKTKIESLTIQKGLEGSVKSIAGKAKEKGIKVNFSSKKVLDSVMTKNDLAEENHQGVIANIEIYKYKTLDDILTIAEESGDAPFLVILDGIEDPHNLGAIIRSSEAAGVHGLIIPEKRSASVNETVVKTSAGAVFHLPIVRVTNISKTIDILKKKNIWVYGLDMDGNSYYKENMTGATALVIGSEGKGISRLVKEKCDIVISIPMKGKVNSLNASNAAAIAIYEVLKQKDEY